MSSLMKLVHLLLSTMLLKQVAEAMQCSEYANGVDISLKDSCDCSLSPYDNIAHVQVYAHDAMRRLSSYGEAKFPNRAVLERLGKLDVSVKSQASDLDNSCIPDELFKFRLRSLLSLEGDTSSPLEVSKIDVILEEPVQNCSSVIDATFLTGFQIQDVVRLSRPNGDLEVHGDVVAHLHQNARVKRFILEEIHYLDWKLSAESLKRHDVEVLVRKVKVSPPTMSGWIEKELIPSQMDDVTVACECSWIYPLARQGNAQLPNIYREVRCSADSTGEFVNLHLNKAWDICSNQPNTSPRTSTPKTVTVAPKSPSPHSIPTNGQMIAIIVLLSVATFFIICIFVFAIVNAVVKAIKRKGTYAVSPPKP